MTSSRHVSKPLRSILRAATLLAALPAAAFAQDTAGPKSINTGGAQGAYHSVFCPPLPPALSRAYFNNYTCTTSRGTLENIERVMATPSAIGFAQLDVYAREAARRTADFQRLTVIRRDIACEGLWMVTKNERLQNYGDVQGFARRIHFILPPLGSGSAASFAFLRENDNEGLGRVPDGNIRHVADATEVIRAVAASTDGAVGFFVQFADPTNANIRLLVEQNLRIVPVVSREIMRSRVDGEAVYQVQEFALTEGGFLGIGGRARNATTACTPVAIFTGNPDAVPAGNARDDQRDLVLRVRETPAAQLLPSQGGIARILSGARRMSQTAVQGMEHAAEAAKQAAQRATN
ncbi:hypothetical protein ACQW02_18940 [Humitalea sp. 24SJ18S-53]|uniref:hypothetical protein n=1 Tax=Humitalea sp. 24SJ18S-53 TaxID=3422307 RepID=UPI003D66C608